MTDPRIVEINDCPWPHDHHPDWVCRVRLPNPVADELMHWRHKNELNVDVEICIIHVYNIIQATRDVY